MKRKILSNILLISASLYADSVSFTIYNDFFVGHDMHFTSASSLIWVKNNSMQKNPYSDTLASLLEKISIPLDTTKHHNAGINLEQMIVTPENTRLKTPQYNDFPYAGYLSLSTFLLEWNQSSFTEYNIEFGVIGKDSGAEFIQNNFHKIIGNEQPRGWNTQINTHISINLLYQRGVKSWQGTFFNSAKADWFNHYGVSMGTFDVSAFGGTTIRIGHNYIQNFNTHYPYLKGEANLLHTNDLTHGFGWSVSTGLETKALLYSAILDGALSEGYQTHKHIFNALACFSTSLYYDKHQLRLFYEIPTPYIEEENKINIFGGLAYSYRF